MIGFIKKALKWLFSVPEGHRTALKIIGWWEIRRIPYNVFIGCVGIISLSICFYFNHLIGEEVWHIDVVEPVLYLFAPFLANIAYTAGWISELALRYIFRFQSQRVGPVLLGLGLAISFLAVIDPALFWASVYFGFMDIDYLK